MTPLKPKERHVPCSCGRRARYFGAFAGGVCQTHALAMMSQFDDGVEQFWPEYRQKLRELHARAAGNPAET